MAYDVGTVINNPTNNTVQDLENALNNILGSDSSGEVASILAAIQQAELSGALTPGAAIVPVTADSTLDPNNGVLHTIGSNANVTLRGNAAGDGQSINVLLGDNSILKLLNANGFGVRAPSSGHASTAAAGGGHASFNVIASGGENSITLNKGPSQVTSTVGNDAIVSRGGKDTITGGSGHDTITAGGKSFVQAGTSGDTIAGGLKASSHDTIVGGSGRDQVVVAHGDNLLVGTTGRTYMQAGDGLDTVLGGTGRETIWGSGSTYIQAARGNIVHAQGSDTVYGGDGRNTIFSGSGGQYIEGGKGHLESNVSKNASATIFGGSRPDVVHVAQSEANIVDTTTSGKTQTITFANGQTLTTQNVTIEFKDHHK